MTFTDEQIKTSLEAFWAWRRNQETKIEFFSTSKGAWHPNPDPSWRIKEVAYRIAPTQEQHDMEAFDAWSHERGPASFYDCWRAALAYARKEQNS